MDHATKLQVIDGETLMDMELAAPKFCVQGLLPQGLCILGGAPKIGKSWLMLDLCVRIAKGEPMWEMETSKGTTLYLCLEDTYFHIQQRLNCITDEVSDHAFFANASFSLAEGLMTQITDFVRKQHRTGRAVQCLRRAYYDRQKSQANDEPMAAAASGTGHHLPKPQK